MKLPKFGIEQFSFVPDLSTRRYVFFADVVEKHEIGKEILNRLEADERVTALNGQMISCGNNASAFETKRIAMWFLWLANESGLDSANEALEAFLANDSIVVLNTLWVLGVIVKDRVNLGDGYRIVRVEDMPESREKDYYLKLNPNHIDFQAIQAKTAIVRKCKIPKIAPANPEVWDATSEFWQSKSRLFDIALLMNLFPGVSCTPHFSTSYSCSTPFGPFSGSGGGIFFPDVLSRTDTLFTTDLAEQLSALIEAFSGKTHGEQQRLHRILHRIAQAKRGLQIEDKILDLSIALEMLLLSDNRNHDQLSLSFRLRGSWLLGTDAESRADLYKKFRDLYNFRSQVAHCGSLCGGDRKKIEAVRVSFSDFASLAEQATKKIILAGPPNWTPMLLGAI